MPLVFQFPRVSFPGNGQKKTRMLSLQPIGLQTVTIRPKRRHFVFKTPKRRYFGLVVNGYKRTGGKLSISPRKIDISN